MVVAEHFTSETSNQEEIDSLEPTVLERIASGDASAVRDCLDQYGGLVWAIAKRLCRTTTDAEDATQEVFIELWQKADRFDVRQSSESTFIAMIARRRLIDRFRRDQAAPEITAMYDEMAELSLPSRESSLELADEASKAAICMSRLSEIQQHVLSLSINHGASHSSISSRLKIPLGTVKSYARRALLQLRECMRRPAVAGEIAGGSHD